MKVLFIIPYPLDSAASQRFRFEQYLPALQKHQIDYEIIPFINDSTWKILYSKGKNIEKLFGIIKGFFRRFLILFSLRKFYFVFIHREAEPLGPPLFEWLTAKVFRKKIIFDFDDAIWLPNFSEHNSFMGRLKNYKNTINVISWSYKVSAGNKYLVNYARQFNENVVLNPTTIDTEAYHNRLKDQNTAQFVIGWTGSHSTLYYIDIILPVLQELEKSYSFQFLIISDKQPQIQLKSLVYRKWRKETEIEDLLQMNIGVMPLYNDQWAWGKCGFKALQYNALGIPAVVSGVGANLDIVKNGVNGFVCNSAEDWKKYFIECMTNKDLLNTLSENSRPVVEGNYSVSSNTSNFINLFS